MKWYNRNSEVYLFKTHGYLWNGKDALRRCCICAVCGLIICLVLFLPCIRSSINLPSILVCIICPVHICIPGPFIILYFIISGVISGESTLKCSPLLLGPCKGGNVSLKQPQMNFIKEFLMWLDRNEMCVFWTLLLLSVNQVTTTIFILKIPINPAETLYRWIYTEDNV